MFFFTITGSESSALAATPRTQLISPDVTYSASILLKSTEPRYILANLSWLVGALATVAQDIFVLGQFAVYNYQDSKARREALFLDEDEEDEDRA
jgi:hypothetical protein